MKNAVKKLLGKTGYSLVHTSVLNAPQMQKQIKRDDFFNLYFSNVDPATFFFVQIGAHDGVHGDPIHEYVVKYDLAGIAVEPQPGVYTRLCETYKGSRVRCLQAAIGAGELTFYTVKDTAKTEGNFNKMTRIASFNKSVIARSLVAKIPRGASPDEYIEATPVRMIDFNQLVRECGIQRIDLLQLDCEGYDYEVLKMIDFEQFSPSLINYESAHFADQTRKECENLLTSNGYRLFRYGSDTCAYKMRQQHKEESYTI